MSKITVTGQLTLTGGQLTAKKTPVPAGPNLWAWGSNTQGQLGLIDTANRSSPVQVGALTNWTIVDGGSNHIGAINSVGELWVWGDNNKGKLGLGDGLLTNDKSSPVQVGNLTTWSSLEFGNDHSTALKTDETLWTWGFNSNGQLGQGDITDRSSPVQVGSLTDWSTTSAAAGGNHTIAIKTNGSLWSWGQNSNGQLGQGDVANRSSPVQIGDLLNWSKIATGNSNSFAVKTDGTLWSWGNNNTRGVLGHGDVSINRSSPVQIGNLTTWTDINSSGATCLALNSLGEIWVWGSNFNGVHGRGDSLIHRSSPVQIGSLTDWSTISLKGDQHAHATKTDGTLWSWGEGASGKLGLEDVADRSSPVQVGTLTTWIKAVSAGKSTFGLK